MKPHIPKQNADTRSAAADAGDTNISAPCTAQVAQQTHIVNVFRLIASPASSSRISCTAGCIWSRPGRQNHRACVRAQLLSTHADTSATTQTGSWLWRRGLLRLRSLPCSHDHPRNTDRQTYGYDDRPDRIDNRSNGLPFAHRPTLPFAVRKLRTQCPGRTTPLRA